MISIFTLLIASALAADEGTSSGDVTIHSTKKPDISVTNKKKSRNKGPRTGSQMPPAGSAATGGTSASPGGAPTTPYGGGGSF